MMELLILGNVTRDLPDQNPNPKSYTLGGSVSYAALTCHRLGIRSELVTRVSRDTDLSSLRAVARCTVLPSPTTTTFVNQYDARGRTQYCYTPAPPITAADLTPRLRRARFVFMCPIMQEVAADVPDCFAPEAFLAAGAQGWLRTIEEDGRVRACDWSGKAAFLRRVNMLILSREDIDYDMARLAEFLEHVPMVMLSNYRNGSDIYFTRDADTVHWHVPPRPAREVDPTGAGDMFATAFLIRYMETGRLWHSARFANITASMGVEGAGSTAIPSRERVMTYLRRHPLPDPED